MQKYAKVVDIDNKMCVVGLGDNAEFYQAAGMSLQEVEKGYNGWYLKGFAPLQPTAQKAEALRLKRNRLLAASDVYMLADYPITEAERELWRQYRSYLRDITLADDFPDLEVLSFAEWQARQNTVTEAAADEVETEEEAKIEETAQTDEETGAETQGEGA